MPTVKNPWAVQAGDWLRLPGHDLDTAYRHLVDVAEAIQYAHAERERQRSEIEEERRLLGLPSHPESASHDPDGTIMRAFIRREGADWIIGPFSDPAFRTIFADCGCASVATPRHGMPEPWLSWSVPPDSTLRVPTSAMADRVARCLAALIERAARAGSLGPEYSRYAIADWADSPSGRRSLDRARRIIERLLEHPWQDQREPMPTLITRGAHIPRQDISERITIEPIIHEGRSDRHGDWGGPRRILAQSQDRTRRVFIAEGHHRVRIGKSRASYTPSSLWIQGDKSEGLFGRDIVIYEGRVSSTVLAEFGDRIERGLSCPGLSGFLSILHTVTFDDGS